MAGLRQRLSRERRRRRLRLAAGTVLAAALLWLVGTGRERPGEAPRLLLAEIPRTTAPAFEPSDGSAVRLSSGALLVRPGGGS